MIYRQMLCLFIVLGESDEPITILDSSDDCETLEDRTANAKSEPVSQGKAHVVIGIGINKFDLSLDYSSKSKFK